MCYKVSTPERKKLKKFLSDQPGYTVADYETFYHVSAFARPYLPLELGDHPGAIVPGLWGLVPQWIHTNEEAMKQQGTFNARGEEVFEKRTYKDPIRKLRGLLWVDGFYESHHGKDKKASPYWIYMQSHEPFTLGCVVRYYADEESGEAIPTFSILTVEANALLARIHNQKKRMPLVILPEDREQWLRATEEDDIRELIRPLPDGFLSAHPVTRDINNAHLDNNYPGVQEEC